MIPRATTIQLQLASVSAVYASCTQTCRLADPRRSNTHLQEDDTVTNSLAETQATKCNATYPTPPARQSSPCQEAAHATSTPRAITAGCWVTAHQLQDPLEPTRTRQAAIQSLLKGPRPQPRQALHRCSTLLCLCERGGDRWCGTPPGRTCCCCCCS